MSLSQQTESRHGVLVCINGKGVFIDGEPGMGKSSLALELLQQGHALVADDIVEFQLINQQLTGHCPPMLSGLLHQRELGTLDITTLFGPQACRKQVTVDRVLSLTREPTLPPQLINEPQTTLILSRTVPKLTLSVTNPATLLTRLMVWMQACEQNNQGAAQLRQRQQQQMTQ